jgi:hypothetical protein
LKQLKSSLSDLHDIFDRSITVGDIAEPVVSFDDHDDAQEVKTFMRERDYDYLGVRFHGHIAGYADREKLGPGRLGEWSKEFETERLISDRTSLLKALSRMRNINPLFVSVHDKVWGIATKGDLQKFPFRMWLFGVLSMVEMHMLRLIRERFSNDEWQRGFNTCRLNKAKELFDLRTRQNEEIDLDDCLQWCDKVAIVAGNANFRELLGFQSKRDAERRLSRMEGLRNHLAHAQDLLTGNWPLVIDITEDAERLLNAMEQIQTTNLVSRNPRNAAPLRAPR